MFANAVKNQWTVTENGMKARVSSASACVDLFYKGGSSRGQDIVPAFAAALASNEDLAMRIALWIRDARGGAGERETFRNILRYLDKTNVDLAIALMDRVPELGRWDDILVVESPRAWDYAVSMIRTALFRTSHTALCAKWMPRKGPIAVKLTKSLALSPKAYRKLIVEHTRVVETQMCNKQWSEINYEHVPSVAASRYRKAFHRNDGERYREYIGNLVSGSAKVNASVVFPHDVIKNLIDGMSWQLSEDERNFIVAQWDSLPNYISNNSVLPMVDVSGSMSSVAISPVLTALHVAVSLGLYASDKNKGVFKDLFLTFSNNPTLQKLEGNVARKIEQLTSADWEMNTNIEAAFKLILTTAVDGNVPQEHMPKYLLILSDMQFDEAIGYRGQGYLTQARSCSVFNPSAMELIKQMYKTAGYAVPKIIFWNLDDRGASSNTPVSYNETGAALVSGYSPAILKSILSGKLEDFTPETVMLETVSSERYRWK
jgi:hypothetical protein